MSREHSAEMDDIRSMVHRLFTALHLEDHQKRKERELTQKLEFLKEQLLPLEQVCKVLLHYGCPMWLWSITGVCKPWPGPSD